MPLVEVMYNAGLNEKGRDIFEDFVANDLLRVVAEALHVESNPAAHLTPNEIEIRIRVYPLLTKNQKDVSIRIEAMMFPERLANKDQRAKMIFDAIQPKIQKRFSLGVWLVLVEGSWIEG